MNSPGVEIGDGCVIGASSVVTHSTPAYHVVVGHPARATRKVAIDVPNAPGLKYEPDGITVIPEQRHLQRIRDESITNIKRCLAVVVIVCCVLSWTVMRM